MRACDGVFLDWMSGNAVIPRIRRIATPYPKIGQAFAIPLTHCKLRVIFSQLFLPLRS